MLRDAIADAPSLTAASGAAKMMRPMVYAFKRLALGVALIAAASAILLVADIDRRPAESARTVRLAIMQHVESTLMEDGVRGVMESLAARGYRHGDGGVTIDRFNAQGDMATSAAIASQLVGAGYDLIITSSTPSMQAVANANREGRARHVFALVADPFASGVGLSREQPLNHPPHMVGQGSFPPVDAAFEYARQMLPSLSRVGVAWNPSESNSLAFVQRGRAVAKQMGLTLLEANADSTAAVTDAIASLIARDAQAIWVGGDNTLAAAIDSVIAVGRRNRVPVFTVLPGPPDRGTLFDTGFDFVEVGRQTGQLAADVLEGADMTKIPIVDVADLVQPYLSVNTTVLEGLREKWHVPEELLARANVVVGTTGIRRRAAAPANRPAATNRPLAKRWNVQFVQLNQAVEVEDAERGVRKGLEEAGLVEGRDYQIGVRNAQGDMPTVSALIDAAVGDRADLIVTFSTPTLQAAMQRTTSIPIVFNYVADPVAAGAGTSDTDHVKNVTGVYLIGAYADMLPLIKAVRPTARVLGTVFVPAEVNMVSQLEGLRRAAAAAGFEIRAMAANSTAEVADATLALIANGIDAICQLPGNLTVSAFPSIAQAARQARMPIFAFQSSQAKAGAVLTLARDYYDSGLEAAALAARVMRGESPAGIPLVGFSGTRLIVNPIAADAAGVALPANLLARADDVIHR
jgi:ABC-type uncharacterized transport system substrate-binding protein